MDHRGLGRDPAPELEQARPEGYWRLMKHERNLASRVANRKQRERHGVDCAAIRKRRVNEINTDYVLRVLQPIWETKRETASRIGAASKRFSTPRRRRAQGWRT